MHRGKLAIQEQVGRRAGVRERESIRRDLFNAVDAILKKEIFFEEDKA
jgi:hypothetical protein